MELKRNLLTLGLVLLNMCLLSTSATAARWYVNSGTGDNTNNGMSATVTGVGIGPFAEIQWALDNPLIMPGDSIYISEGEYYGNIHIDRPVFIFGKNAGIAGTSSTRGLETILFPNATDLTRTPNSSTCLIYIKSDRVHINGIRMDGDNSSINSSNDVRGRDIDLAYAISNSASFDNVSVTHCVFENFHVSGIHFGGNINGPNVNGMIYNNMFNNFGNNSIAIYCKGFYSGIIQNSIDNVGIGIWLTDFRLETKSAWVISNNNVVSEITGLSIENLYNQPSALLVENNMFTTPVGYISDFGIHVANNTDKVKLTFNNNNISNTSEGYRFSNNNILKVVLSNDTIVNCDYGFRLDNYQNNKKTDSLLFTNCQYNSISAAGIDVFNDSSRLDLILTNCILKNSETAILLRGNCSLTPGNTAFEKINSYYIFLGSAISDLINTADVNANACTFNGITGSAATDSINFLTEDKIRHYLDDNILAYVSFKPQYIYITTNDGNFWIEPAFRKAADGWHIYLDTVDCPEDVVVTKSINFHTRGDVSIGSFVMNGPGKTLTLYGPITMSNTLTLLQGIVNTNNGIATIGQPAFLPPNPKVSGGSATSYVDGPLQIVASSNTRDTVYFPVGKGGDFRPISIITEASIFGALGVLHAESFNGPGPLLPTGNGITHTSLVHHWHTKNMDDLVFDKVFYMASYGVFSNNDEVSRATELRLAVEQNNTWTNIGGMGTSNLNGLITSTDDNTSFSYVALANVAMGTNKLGKSGPVAAFDALLSCFPDSTQFNDISASLSGPITSWKWNFGDASTLADTSNKQNPRYKYAQPGKYTVSLTVSTALLETDVVTKEVEILAPPTAGFEELVPCFPMPVLLRDTSLSSVTDPIAGWVWKVNGAPYLTNTVSHNFAATGSYSVSLIVTTAFGCVDSVTRIVFQGDSVKIKISPPGPLTICENDNVTLTATAGIKQYLWSNGGITNTTTVGSAGIFKVIGINSSLCSGIDSITVATIPSPTANAGADFSIKFGESVVLAGSGGGNYDWSPAGSLSNKSIATPIATPKSTTKYVLRVFDAFGCEDFDTVEVVVEPLGDFDIPNLITPNGDGHNDVWDISFLPGYDSAKVSVISRWGKVVFVSFAYKNDWKGTHNGSDLPDGSYIYIIENKDTFGTIKGSIQILR